ncbi:MAG TPA: hypothetical protein DCZ69_16395 [Syntrophobacteraceae bacterium]|nr:hypothetical protein [Syntrophobacteraceae bacterium]
MDQDQRPSSEMLANPLQPIMEVMRGDDPDVVCARYQISRAELSQRLEEYQKTQRQMALADQLTFKRVGRNDPCPCGSGKKYKKCCLSRQEEVRQNVPADAWQEAEELARRREKLEKDIQHAWDLLYAQEYDKAGRVALQMLESFPEDDRVHDILLTVDLATGRYEEAFVRARRRWQVAQEEKQFYQEKGYHKREGEDRKQIVHFFSPSTWLEIFWIAQRARAYAKTYAANGDPAVKKLAEKLLIANDHKRFPGRQQEGLEMRRQALSSTLEQLAAAGPAIIPCLLPLTYTFSWACLFVPEVLYEMGTDECILLLAELSMFRRPHFAQQCLTFLEKIGARALPPITRVIEENPAFDELKTGLIMVLGTIHTPESFALLARLTEHESPDVFSWAARALEQHNNPEALPYLEKAKTRLDKQSEIGGAIRELAAEKE